MDELTEKLKGELLETTWDELRSQLVRDSIILVDPALNLLEVGLKVVQDDKTAIAGWIGGKQMTKPTTEQLKAWEAQLDKKFKMLIVQPFVLAQEQLQ